MRISPYTARCVLVSAVLLVPCALSAQGPDNTNPVAPRPIRVLTSVPHSAAPGAVAVRMSTGIEIDGQLDEIAWSEAPPITDFTQNDPEEGQPVSEPTDVRFLYDDDALYVGGRLYDSAPVTTRLARRDAMVPDSDFLIVVIDSYHDHQTAYRFATNPSGMKRDQVMSGRGFGGGGRFGRGGGGSSWDPVWDVATTVTDEGWFVEMRIPFSQLRFSPEDDQHWGIQIERTINRKQERAVFSFTPKLEATGVARYGHLTGIRGVGGGRKLELLPYVGMSAEYVDQAPSSQVAFGNPYRSGSDYFGRAGLDLKYRLGSNLTLNAAVNPDFGQVEADPAVINLTAFETRFDERRPFFVEGAEIFRFGSGGPGGSTGRAPQVMYSRRIGRRPQGQVSSSAVFSDAPTATTILGATKITGKVRGNWSIGLLEAFTGREYAPYVDDLSAPGTSVMEPPTNYLVGRVRRDLRAGQTRIGMMATSVNRDINNAELASRLRTSAYVAGMDLMHEWANRGWRINGAFASSYVEGDPEAMIRTQRSSARYFQRPDADHVQVDSNATSMGGYYAMADLSRQSGSVQGKLAMAALSPGYEVNDMGFQTETDRYVIDTDLSFNRPRPGNVFRNWRLWGSPDFKWNSNGDLISSNFNGNFRFQWLNYWGGSVRAARDFASYDDRLTRGGPLARSPGRYSANINMNSDFRKPLSVWGRYSWESKDDGSWKHTGGLSFTYKSGEKIELRLGPSVTKSFSAAQYVSSVGDALATETFGRRYIFAPIDQTTVSMETRVNVTFTPTLTLEVFAQPFVSNGDFGNLMEFDAPGTYSFSEYGTAIGTNVRQNDGDYLIDPDGAGAAAPFTVGDRDFNFRSLLGNAVLRWEWSPGSTLFLVWQQSRSHRIVGSDYDIAGAQDIGTFDFRTDTSDLFSVQPDNIFLIKVSYWLNL